MLVQFGNNWIQKIPLTAKLDEAAGPSESDNSTCISVPVEFY